jgi:hypothetical protein
MGDWLTPGWEATGRERRQRLAQIEATERRLKGNPAALRAFHRDQARQLEATKRNYQQSHPGEGCFTLIGLLGLLGVLLVRAVRRR